MSLALAGFLVDSALSLFGAYLLCVLVGRLIARPRWTKWVMTLPFVKVLFDIARGLGSNAYAFSEHAGARWDLGRFQVGASIAPPSFQGSLGARAGDHWFSIGVGDMLTAALLHIVRPAAVTAMAGAVLAISIFLAARRIAGAIQFERDRRMKRAHAEGLDPIHIGARTVDIYISNDASGTPFTGGWLKPYVVVPTDARAKLDAGELQAALLHELGHVRAFDALIFFLLGILGDLLWFVPFVGRPIRAARAEAERAADAFAVRSGADPLLLASAITRLASADAARAGAIPFASASSAALRIRALLDPSAVPESPARTASRFALATLVAYAALFSTFLTKS